MLPAQLKEAKAAERAGFWRREDEGELQFAREQCIHVVLDATIVQTHVHVRHRAVIGIQDNVNIEILSGVAKDEEIITGPYNVISKTLKNNEKVSKLAN